VFVLARHGQYLSAPLDHPGEKRILDLGCGTGIWAIDFAEFVTFLLPIELHLAKQLTWCFLRQDPSRPVFVRGVDLALIQPDMYVPHCVSARTTMLMFRSSVQDTPQR
jgi:SAM-dependent methyltransferase